MVKVKVLSTIKHDEIIYEFGDVFECSEAEAQALVDAGAAQFDSETAPRGGKKAKSKRVDKQPKGAKVEGVLEVDPNAPSIDWTRAQLDAHAEKMGIDTATMPSKAAVLEAIEQRV